LPELAVATPAAPALIPLGPLPGIDADGKIIRHEPGEPVVFEPEPPPPDPDSWEAVAAAARPAALGRIGPVMNNELANLQPSLARCLDEETQARNGQFPVSRSLDGRTPDENATTLLVLQLELSPGQIRIVDAPVESQGRSSDGRVACAQRLLRGRVIRTPVVQGAGRARMVLPLTP
jgi:hypothetical protein